MILILYKLWKGILSSARTGQKLPILTILFILQIIIHFYFASSTSSSTSISPSSYSSSYSSSSTTTTNDNDNDNEHEHEHERPMFTCITKHPNKYSFHTSCTLTNTPTWTDLNTYFLLPLNLFLFIIPGYTLLFYLYKHSVTTIFNKRIPSPSTSTSTPTSTTSSSSTSKSTSKSTKSTTVMDDLLSSFILHLTLLKPIDILFRYITYRFRVLPDIIVLGEVRCGTTSFCQHLATALKDYDVDDDDIDIDDGSGSGSGSGDGSHDGGEEEECQVFIDCHTPFCLWSHPELDHKETFYFVGHYLRMVTPQYYTMCFPLKIIQQWNELKYMVQYYYLNRNNNNNNNNKNNNSKTKRRKRKKPLFITFDGCAQYLSSPTAPYLIAEAYKLKNQKPPIIISCIRDPIKQCISWWKYETNAQRWGESIGLYDYNTELRGDLYPPDSIVHALEYTNCDDVNDLYDRANDLFSLESLFEMRCRGSSGSGSHHVFIPPWAMSWPGGQLSGIGRNGKFIQNMNRFEKVFREAFDDDDNHYSDEHETTKKKNYGSITSTNATTATTAATTTNDSKELQSLKYRYRYMNILPIEYLSNEELLKKFMVNILKKVALRKEENSKERNDYMCGMQNFERSKRNLSNVHRNASSSSTTKSQQRQQLHNTNEFDDDTMRALNEYFAADQESLNSLISKLM